MQFTVFTHRPQSNSERNQHPRQICLPPDSVHWVSQDSGPALVPRSLPHSCCWVRTQWGRWWLVVELNATRESCYGEPETQHQRHLLQGQHHCSQSSSLRKDTRMVKSAVITEDWKVKGVVGRYPGHWCLLSVRGTYTTPIKAFLMKVPSLCRSYCSNTWLPPSGPTGRTSRPPGFSCSRSWNTGHKNVKIDHPLQGPCSSSLVKILCSYSLWNCRCSCTNMDGIIWRSIWEAHPSVSHWGRISKML